MVVKEPTRPGNAPDLMQLATGRPSGRIQVAPDVQFGFSASKFNGRFEGSGRRHQTRRRNNAFAASYRDCLIYTNSEPEIICRNDELFGGGWRIGSVYTVTGDWHSAAQRRQNVSHGRQAVGIYSCAHEPRSGERIFAATRLIPR